MLEEDAQTADALIHKLSDPLVSSNYATVLDDGDDALIRNMVINGKTTQKEGVEVFMDYKGYVAADKIPSVLNQSSILLLLTNKSSEQGPKGVMTTKFFESLAVRKPILCVRSDEGVLETALLESQAGIAARQKKEVCSFLLKYINEWKEKGFTTSSIRSEVLQNYSRKEQAKQFVRIFENIIQ